MRTHDLERVDNSSLSYPIVKVKLGGGLLEEFEINELHDGNTYLLPLANSVPYGAWVLVELPQQYGIYEPLVQRSGSDIIRYSEGTDTEVLFDVNTVSVRFVSDGVSEWRI